MSEFLKKCHIEKNLLLSDYHFQRFHGDTQFSSHSKLLSNFEVMYFTTSSDFVNPKIHVIIVTLYNLI